MLSKGQGVQGLPGLAPAARRQRSQAGGIVHQAEALMHVQSLTPPSQLSPQALDLLPQGMVVFLQQLVLLEGEADGWGEGCQPHRKLSMNPVSSQPHPTPQGPQFRGKIPPLCECPSWGPSATFWPATHQHYQVSPILPATGAQMRLLSTLNSLSWWSLPACGCHPPGSSTSLPTGCSHPKAPCSLGPKEPLGNCVINRTVKPSILPEQGDPSSHLQRSLPDLSCSTHFLSLTWTLETFPVS